MSNFNSKQASDTIPTFDGKPKHLDIFLSMVEMVYDEFNTQGKTNLIKFVMAMKLNDRVRNILMLEKIPTTFDDLKAALTSNFKPTKTASCLHSEIRDMKQRGSVLNYRDKLNSLIAELTLLQITELGERPNEVARSTIKTMNEKLALEIFQKGLHENIRIAVIAAQPSSLTKAYEIASTQEQLLQPSNTANLFHVHRSNNRNNRDNYKNNRYNNGRNFGNKNRSNFNRNSLNHRYNNPSHGNNQQRNRNPTNRDNNRNNNNNGRNFHNQINNNNSRYNNNHRNRHANINTIQQQGNDQTLETHYESPNREN